MNAIAIDPAELKRLIKSAVVEAMSEQQAVLQEMLDEKFEDVALGRAIEDAKKSPTMSKEEFLEGLGLAKAMDEADTTRRVSREEIFAILDAPR